MRIKGPFFTPHSQILIVVNIVDSFIPYILKRFRFLFSILQCWPPTRMKTMNHPIFATFSLELGWNCLIFLNVLHFFVVFAIFRYDFQPIRRTTLYISWLICRVLSLQAGQGAYSDSFGTSLVQMLLNGAELWPTTWNKLMSIQVTTISPWSYLFFLSFLQFSDWPYQTGFRSLADQKRALP